MKTTLKIALASIALLGTSIVSAQSANGWSGTVCTQSGQTLTCTTTTTYGLPAGVNLQAGSNVTQFSLGGATTTPPPTNPTQTLPLTGCTISPANPTVPQQSTTTLSAACATGGTTATYAWSKNGVPVVGSSSSLTLTAQDTANVGVIAVGLAISNSVSSTTVNANVTVTNKVGVSFCPGNQTFNTTFSATETYKKVYSTNLIGTTTHWVVKIPVLATDTTVGRQLAGMNFGEAPSNQRAFRKVSISKNMCDYTPAAGVTYLLATNSNSGGIELRINDLTRSIPPIELTTGTWYFNVQNTSCPAGQRCDALLEWLN